VNWKCLFGLHEDWIERAYSTPPSGRQYISGEVRVCTKCGRLKKLGNARYPKHFLIQSMDVKRQLKRQK